MVNFKARNLSFGYNTAKAHRKRFHEKIFEILLFFEILPFLTKIAIIGKTQNTPTFFLNFLLEFTNIGPERATWEFSERYFALY